MNPAPAPSRLRFLGWIAAVFLAVNSLVRIGLMAWEAARAGLPPDIAKTLALGLAFDVVALAWVLVPFAILHSLFRSTARGRRLYAWCAGLAALTALYGMLFVALAEFVFWNEFSARFNFIAVDYLVYTREVLGNIRESYPVAWLLGALVVVALAVAGLTGRRVVASASGVAPRWWRRLAVPGAALAIALGCTQLPVDEQRDRLESAAARELAGNGYYDFFRALRNNDLDYRRYYRVVNDEQARTTLRNALGVVPAAMDDDGPVHPAERRVIANEPPRPLHVVMVSIESLGADYVESLGGRPGLTPSLDRLGRDGLLFTQLHATGLRTVRGLEALTLSMPPTPGHAVPMRRNVPPLQSLGSVLRENGYETLYLYGGYAVFDNMRDFFGRNGYEVIDRSAIPASEIAHENIWGVADEHLFDLALRELDARTSAGRRVFAHVMTTSNHRPFTYPEGRIDLPSGSGRDGAVKYTDWAIGEFLRKAGSRPWFDDTVFVLVADHTSNGRGRTDLPPENYRIPMVIYSPRHIAPGRVEFLASQIDVAPTILGLLNVSYTSRFFGHDILRTGESNQRALLSNYLTVGYLSGGVVVELGPKRRVRAFNAGDGSVIQPDTSQIERHVAATVAYYQTAAGVLRSGQRAD